MGRRGLCCAWHARVRVVVLRADDDRGHHLWLGRRRVPWAAQTHALVSRLVGHAARGPRPHQPLPRAHPRPRGGLCSDGRGVGARLCHGPPRLQSRLACLGDDQSRSARGAPPDLSRRGCSPRALWRH
eukprot:Amastigsp_a842751_28.p2 type:complete len:128 gc:universal Amastigsp_a842751_28:492-109(-)